MLVAPVSAIRGHSSGRNWESCVATTVNPSREICRAQGRSPSAALAKPNIREGHCAHPGASGVAVPTESKVLGSVGVHLCGPLFRGVSPLETAFHFLPICFLLLENFKLN